jgi:hypothetical protein
MRQFALGFPQADTEDGFQFWHRKSVDRSGNWMNGGGRGCGHCGTALFRVMTGYVGA